MLPLVRQKDAGSKIPGNGSRIRWTILVYGWRDRRILPALWIRGKIAMTVAKARILLEALHKIAPALTDEEVSDIANVILSAINRLEKEQKEEEK